jgi:hypothetical protein
MLLQDACNKKNTSSESRSTSANDCRPLPVTATPTAERCMYCCHTFTTNMRLISCFWRTPVPVLRIFPAFPRSHAPDLAGQGRSVAPYRVPGSGVARHAIRYGVLFRPLGSQPWLRNTKTSQLRPLWALLLHLSFLGLQDYRFVHFLPLHGFYHINEYASRTRLLAYAWSGLNGTPYSSAAGRDGPRGER